MSSITLFLSFIKLFIIHRLAYAYAISVDRALEGEFTIDNLTFTPGLADHDSKEFKEIAASVEEEVI